MPAAARLGDNGSGHGCFPATPIIAGSGDVSINGKPAARKGDAILLHACPCPQVPHGIHGRSISAGSANVSINGKPAARVGDAIDCGGSVAAGSGNVLIGDTPYKSPTHDCGEGAALKQSPFLSIQPLAEPPPFDWASLPFVEEVFSGAAKDKQKVVEEKRAAPSAMRQTGGGGESGSADELYDKIRASNTDVSAIAHNTGIKAVNIQKVKDHVFYNKHLLDKYVDYGVPAELARFDSDLNQAQAWQRLKDGTHTEKDMTWLKHEMAEQWYESKHNSGYTEAHNAAERKWTGDPWGES